ncbi:MAG: transposase [Gracilimonas sp.]|nr:transposase [Gracilimonas sp.]
MTFYRRNLPHWQPKGGIYFVTFILADSLPNKAIKKIQQQRNLLANLSDKGISNEHFNRQRIIYERIFNKYEHLIHGKKSGSTWLSDPEIAAIVKEAIHYRDNVNYILYAYCIMSNHVHLVFQHLAENDRKEAGYPITDIMGSLKKYTARLANLCLNRTGQSFWHPESYDRVVRNSDELYNVIYYTLNNPVKAGLVKHWKEWPNSYCKDEFLEWL